MPTRQELANAIRVLSMDAVERASSGHPGMPMGMADIAEVLWSDFLQHNPNNPQWVNRDRFILSNGHGSMLQYALLHLSGYEVGIEDLKAFRQLHSITPGHPELDDTPGIETTTGPLGQGLANGVGMAIAERMLSAQFNRDSFPVIDHYTYVFVGDGCLMEGISHEACSLAGTLGLGKLIVLYDDNGVSIDGQVTGWFTDSTPERFRAYGWQVMADVDGHHPEQIKAAIEQAQQESDKPTLICCRTVIGYGAPNLAGSEKVHGAPLGGEEISASRSELAWQYEPFHIPESLYTAWDARERGGQQEQAWQEMYAAYQKQYPDLASQLMRRIKGELPVAWSDVATHFIQQQQDAGVAMATRKASQQALEAYGPILPELIGGSADLTGSNNTRWSGSTTFTHANLEGNYIYYGVREFAMSAIMNGLALHGGFIPYGGTFLVFCDYARNAVRLSALMKQRVVFVYTHDSIGLGEDGPTHQPIEHVGMLRLTPDISVWRPCDTVETAVAWQMAVEHQGPSALLLSRQTLPHQERDTQALSNMHRGGYILRDCAVKPEVLIIATGSEVSLAIEAFDQLTAQGVAIRVVSMLSTDRFDAQSTSYREQVLPSAVRKRVAVEAASSDYWYKYVGLDGKIIGLNSFGASAPAKAVFEHFGITTQAVVDAVKTLLSH